MSYATNAAEALRARFSPEVLADVARCAHPDVLRAARVRRAHCLSANRWEETPESARETPVIVTLDAFIRHVHPEPHAVPWEGGIA